MPRPMVGAARFPHPAFPFHLHHSSVLLPFPWEVLCPESSG
jgi:hypothetical protein